MCVKARKRAARRWSLVYGPIVLLASAGRCTGSAMTAPRLVHRSAGTIAYIAPQPDGTGRHFVVAEWPRIPGWPPTTVSKSALRFVRLDVQTGDSQVIREIERSPSLMLFERFVSVARTGRIALIDPRRSPYPIEIIETDGSMRTVKEQKAEFVYGPAWHPDSNHLLFFAYRVSESGVQTGGAKLLDIPRDGTVLEKELPPVSSWSAIWSSDGSTVYSLWPMDRETARIEAVAWPTLTRRVLATTEIPYVNDYYPVERLLIAQDSGDLVWLSPLGARSGKAGFEVWRMRPGKGPTATPLELSAAPAEVAISPDGRRLAVARSDGRITLGDLEAGVKTVLPHLPSRLCGRVWLEWAQQGHALVVASSEGHEVWLVPITQGG